MELSFGNIKEHTEEMRPKHEVKFKPTKIQCKKRDTATVRTMFLTGECCSNERTNTQANVLVQVPSLIFVLAGLVDHTAMAISLKLLLLTGSVGIDLNFSLEHLGVN